MSTASLRRAIKLEVDRLPVDRLPSLADYVEFLGRQALARRIASAERSVSAGKATAWRKVRKDV
jgi:hypothetical protein